MKKLIAEVNTVVESLSMSDLVRRSISPGVPLNSDELTHTHVLNHLHNADKYSEEVETQAFGLELDDGKIVKVYVAVEDADEFEQTLARALGEQDDIEEILDNMSDDFDIVDVVWPDEGENENNLPDDSKDEFDGETADIEQDIAEPEEPEPEPEPESEESEESEGDEEEPEEPENEMPPEEQEDEMPPEEQEDEGEGEENPDDDEEEEDKKKKKKAKKESIGSNFLRKVESEDKRMKKNGDISLGKSFLKRAMSESKEEVLDEAAEVVNLGDSDMNKLYKEAPTRYQKMLIKALAYLGMPGSIAMQRHALFRKKISDASENIIQDSNLRIWIKKFIDAVESKEVTEDEDAELEKQIQNKFALIAFHTIMALGIPEEIIKVSRSSVKKSVASNAVKIVKIPSAKVALMMLADVLGTSKVGNSTSKGITEPPVEETKVVEADSDENLLGTTIFSRLILRLATLLGIPEDNLRFRNTQVRHSINIRKQEIKGLPAVTTRIQQLIKLLEPEGGTTEDIEDIEDIIPENEIKDVVVKPNVKKYSILSGTAVSEKAEPVKLDTWIIEKLGDKITLRNTDINLEFSGEDIETLINALGDATIATFSLEGKRITFRPTNHGKDYVIKNGDDKFPNGVVFDRISIDNFMDVAAKSNVGIETE